MIIISFQSLALPSDKCQVGGRASLGGSATMAEQIGGGISFLVSDRQLLLYINHHHHHHYLHYRIIFINTLIVVNLIIIMTCKSL